MRPFRFVHMADVHLDSPLASRSASIRKALREAQYTAFRRAIDLAIARRADAVLIAGDLFDHATLSFRSERELLAAFARLREAGICVLYATGNHDPGDPAARVHRLSWPDNVVRFVDATPRTHSVECEGRVVGRVTGAGHAHGAETRNLAAAFPPAQAGIPHVALLHTQVVSAAEAQRHLPYAPSTVPDFEAKGFDYWALGHVHARQAVASEPAVHYAGNIQGRDPSETGPKGVLWVEIGAGGAAEVEFVPLAPIVWETWELPCPPQAHTLNELVAAIVSATEIPRPADGTGRIARLRLFGPSPLAFALSDPVNVDELAELLCERLDLVDVELSASGVTRPLDLGGLRAEPSVLSQALALCETLAGDPELLARLVPTPLAGTPDGRPTDEYLTRLVAELDLEVATRLLREGNP